MTQSDMFDNNFGQGCVVCGKPVPGGFFDPERLIRDTDGSIPQLQNGMTRIRSGFHQRPVRNRDRGTHLGTRRRGPRFTSR
jgi:hypothetical protein